jgi:2-oxoglutarate dehydrogenase E1 component
MSQSIKDHYQSSPLFGANAPYVEDLYETWQRDPAAVPENWQQFFAAMEGSQGSAPARRARAVARPAPPVARRTPARQPADALGEKQAAVARLIQVYSQRGYQMADLDPLGLAERRVPQVLRPEHTGLADEDMELEFFTTGLASTGGAKMKLKDIVALLRRVYSGKVGVEFAHISRGRERNWLRERFEKGMLEEPFSAADRRHVLAQLSAAEGIERYLHTRYVGQKRFSLEGGESLIPMLDDLIQQGGARGVQEIILGMAHRGRIMGLVNVVG